MYRFVVTLLALVVCAAGGAWAALLLPDSVLVIAGVSAGLAVGVVSAFLLVHDRSPVAARAVQRTLGAPDGR
jgi:hypothetical protein